MTAARLTLTSDTWVVSDTHFFHDHIVAHCRRPVDHDDLMFANWERLVRPTDVVLHCGDVMVGQTFSRIKALPGTKYLIRGNHDRGTVAFYAEQLGFNVVPSGHYPILGRNDIVWFSHKPCVQKGHWSINIHGHTHHKQHDGLALSHARYINVSVEMMNYQPQRLADVLSGNVGRTL